MNYLGKHAVRRTLALSIASIAVIATSMSSCKKASPIGARGCDDVLKMSEAFSKAINAFSEDPSVANCDKMKKIGVDYLKAAQNCNLYPEYKKAAEDAIADWKDMDCSEFADN
ncbi:MAG TPA: hypothetical protein VNQ80_19780 [Parapedobacter sp.]|uniref:hypothetical protein n=1 Tax=Parapedobacter sp. TaxID=1958893 RepID=UPI002C351137|nr:hypothetical protein [Parapedobacter sp.]HWK59592.1 hypothetical protein [Parapedobacter sp.]